jgi:hypothetical protein
VVGAIGDKVEWSELLRGALVAVIAALVVLVATLVMLVGAGPAASSPTLSRQSGFPVENNATSSPYTLGVSTVASGDLEVVAARTKSPTADITGLSGGNVSSWTQVENLDDSTNSRNVYLFYGVVNATGSSTITATVSGTPVAVELIADEWHASGATGWTVDVHGHQANTSTRTVTFPSLTPTSSNELWWGYADVDQDASTTGATGATFDPYWSATGNNEGYSTSATGGTALQPTESQASAALRPSRRPVPGPGLTPSPRSSHP